MNSADRHRLDDLDRQIIQHYVEHPGASATNVAGHIPLSKAAVHKRIQKLKATGVLSLKTHVSDEAFRTRYIVWLTLNIEKINSHPNKTCFPYNTVLNFMQFLQHDLFKNPSAERFFGKVLVEDIVVAMGSGSHDILLRLAFADDEFALFFVTEILNCLPGVTHTESQRVFTASQLSAFYKNPMVQQFKERTEAD